MGRQITLAETLDELGAARTNKKDFLEKLERIIPWNAFMKIIQPHYYKGERGNKPHPTKCQLVKKIKKMRKTIEEILKI